MAAVFGEVFTRRWVVDLILDLAGYTPDRPLHSLTIVEPSVGSGAFLGPILDRLLATMPRHWTELAACIRAFDIQPANVASCRRLAEGRLTSAGCPPSIARELAETWVVEADFLLACGDTLFNERLAADVVVGNPPYIRIEDIEPGLLATYRHVAPTMGGRADLYVGFFEHGLDLLKPGGVLAYICADRWMRNGYGRDLRRKVVRGFATDAVLVMHDADAFESEVSAYPAITVLRKGAAQGTISARATAAFGDAAARDFAAWTKSAAPELRTDAVVAARLPEWHTTDAVWPDADAETLAWLADLAGRYPLIEDARTRIGIGIATGADRVYIQRHHVDVEPSRLVPMVTPGAVKGDAFAWTGEHLVSPWEGRKVVDLAEYPRLARYYAQHRPLLGRRNVAGRSPHWFRTIDSFNPELMASDLLVMQDMKLRAHPVRVPAGFYPHHNLTWVSSTAWDLDVLGGFLLSDFVERQVAAHCVRMRGNTLRFQPTVLRKVRLPRPEDVPAEVAAALADAFRSRDRDAASWAAASLSR
jgi:adenine-specific DNA-methyltransferase